MEPARKDFSDHTLKDVSYHTPFSSATSTEGRGAGYGGSTAILDIRLPLAVTVSPRSPGRRASLHTWQGLCFDATQSKQSDPGCRQHDNSAACMVAASCAWLLQAITSPFSDQRLILFLL